MAEGGAFVSERAKIIKLYKDSGEPFTATTRPYKSTLPIVFDVVDTFAGAATPISHLVARKNQVLTFFNYGIGNEIGDGFGGTTVATEDDTNMGTANATDGGMDFIIEGISSTCRSTRIQYPVTVVAAGPITDPDVISAYTGTGQPRVVFADPAALMSPPQVRSPFNLEMTLYQRIAPQLSVFFQFDRKRIEKIGTLDEIPEGGAQSLLLASGNPDVQNKYRIPEGFRWRRAGETDSNFNLVVQLQRAVVIPINLTGLFGAAFSSQTTILPTKVAIDISIRAHGLAVSYPSGN